jgi:Protein of unknown function (DUF2946)
MIWRRNNRGTRPAVWLAVFAILLQALLPGLHHPAGMALAGDRIAGLDIAQYLCVAPGGTTPDDPGKAPAHHHVPPCALCSSMHAIGGFAPPDALVIAVSRDYGIVVPTAVTLALPRRQVDLPQQARAPPVLI